MSCSRTAHHWTFNQYIHKAHIPVYFFPLIVNVTSVSELQQEKQHLSTSVSVLHGFCRHWNVIVCSVVAGQSGQWGYRKVYGKVSHALLTWALDRDERSAPSIVTLPVRKQPLKSKWWEAGQELENRKYLTSPQIIPSYLPNHPVAWSLYLLTSCSSECDNRWREINMLAIWYNSFIYIAALLCEVYELCRELCQLCDVSLMTAQCSCKKAV